MKRVYVYFKILRYYRDHLLISDAHPVYWSYSPVTRDVIDAIGVDISFYRMLDVTDDQFALLCDLVPYVLDH